MSYGTFIKRTLKGTLIRNRADFFFGTDGSAGPESEDPDVRVASWVGGCPSGALMIRIGFGGIL